MLHFEKAKIEPIGIKRVLKCSKVHLLTLGLIKERLKYSQD